MIQLRDITLEFGKQIIFDHIACTLEARQRVGLVGRNGAGKSTLLKVIAGMQQVDNGAVSIERHKRVAYLPQEVILASSKTVFDETLSVFEHFENLEREKNALEELFPQAPENIDELLERYVAIQEEIATFDRAGTLATTITILKGLGFLEERQQQPVAELSEGWKMRVVLAKLLLLNADFYLFDEPTNHLDIVAKEWFLNFLKNARFGFLLVSHDRHYLENCCTHIFELERGKGTMFYGNFSKYLEQKEQQRAALHSAYERQQREISRKQATIDRFRAGTRATQAQSMIKQLEKIELIEIEPPMPTVNFSFPPVVRAGQVVLKIDDVRQQFEERTIFNHVSCEIQRGEKVALVAANGVGKTTLFNIITGKYPLQQGNIEFGYNVQPAVFEQDQTRVLDARKTIFQEVADACRNIPESTIRALLGCFLFSGDDVNKKIGVLSGGERNRVAMVKVLLQKANFLLLDEPTNHLDLYAKEILLQALQRYEGTMLFVSHDHDFLARLATRILELTPNGILNYPGTYESYLWQKQQESVQQTTPHQSRTKKNAVPHHAQPSASPSTGISQKEVFSLRKERSTLLQSIERLEHELAQLGNLSATLTYGSQPYNDTIARITTIEHELNEKTKRWEQIEVLLDDVTSQKSG